MAHIIQGLRVPYRNENDIFLESNLTAKEPISQFSAWLQEACENKEIREPNAMCLATADKYGHPSVRIMLLKDFDKSGFKFFTNYDSRKGKELAENPYASICIYWEPCKRSVRIEGRIEKLSREESAKYFYSRPKANQISACASSQSEITRFDILKEKREKLEEECEEKSKDISLPESWGGYLLIPNRIEFWQGQSNRFHDRIVFRQPKNGEVIDPSITFTGEDGWVYERLAP